MGDQLGRMFTIRGPVPYLIIFTLILASLPGIEGSDPIIERYIVTGSVTDNRTYEGLFNYTVRVDKEGFNDRQVKTDGNGTFRFILPPGNFTFYVYSPKGIHVGYKELVIGPHLTNHWDFEIDPLRPQRSLFTGRVMDDIGDPVKGAKVSLNRNDPFWTNKTITDDEGRFTLMVPSGTYYLMIEYNGKVRLNKTVDLDWAEKIEVNHELDLSDERPLLTIITDFIVDHWQDLLFLVGILILILVFYGLFLVITSRLKKTKKELFESEWFTPIRRFVGRIAILIFILLIGRQIARLSGPVEDYVWSWLPRVGLAVAGALFIIMVMRIILFGDKLLWDYLRKGKKGKTILPQQLITLLEMITRYLVLIIGGAVIFILILSSFGLSSQIISRSGDFLSDNAGKMLFLVALIVVGILAKKLIDIFFQEVSTRSSKVSPQVMEMSKKGITGMIYFVISLIFMFTLLSIGGLGDIGQTFILVISMIVGLVVSFAATGSIGNMLSGLVLVTMKPFDIGDRVEFSDGMMGNVENMGIMFTRIKDLEGRCIEIPNNNILMGNITNFSSSTGGGGFAVYIDVTLGYDIHPKKVRSLMKRAAITSPGVLKDPSPKVLVREFHDHAVEYRLRAYVEDPQNMLFIRSSVMESMLVIFHEEGLEILSPLYHVKREGKVPSEEELSERSTAHSEMKEEVVTGLTMFDDIENMETDE